MFACKEKKAHTDKNKERCTCTNIKPFKISVFILSLEENANSVDVIVHKLFKVYFYKWPTDQMYGWFLQQFAYFVVGAACRFFYFLYLITNSKSRRPVVKNIYCIS